MTFEVEQFTSVRLTNINPRMEKHGVESVPAVDINFTMDAANDVLSYFDGALLTALYTLHEKPKQEQTDLDGVPAVSHLPNLRFPKMAPLRWDWKGAGYALEIDYGLGSGRNIALEGVEVGKFVIDCKEGGTVELKFQCQCVAGLTEAIMGKLSLMIGQEVKIELRAPTTVEQTGAKFDPLFPDYKPDAPLTATDVFLNGVAGDTGPDAVH